MRGNEPIVLAERRAARRAKMPDALTAAQLRKASVGRMRFAITNLLEDNIENVQDWIDLVAWVDGPKAALDVYIKLLEFGVPKLTRAEVSVEDGDKTKKAEFTMAELQGMLRDARVIEGECEHVENDNVGYSSRDSAAEAVSDLIT